MKAKPKDLSDEYLKGILPKIWYEKGYAAWKKRQQKRKQAK